MDSDTRINADFTQRVAVHAQQLAWQASPTPGIERRMLDRIGGEIARATSIVRYAPGSDFPTHEHELGEEFFVLEGVFQDQYGDYSTGYYVRNPPLSSHKPRSKTGCTIFVKLRQFDPRDRAQDRFDTGKIPLLADANRPSVHVALLHRDAREEVHLERWDAHSTLDLPLPGGAEVLVLAGSFVESTETFSEHSWLRLPVDSRLRACAGAQGCKVWIKLGHLRYVNL